VLLAIVAFCTLKIKTVYKLFGDAQIDRPILFNATDRLITHRDLSLHNNEIVGEQVGRFRVVIDGCNLIGASVELGRPPGALSAVLLADLGILQLGCVTVRGEAVAVRRARTGNLFLGAATAGTTASVCDKIF
jgi:hypothetical protein